MYSKSSTVLWMMVSGWLMVAGREILVRSLPMACLRMEKSEKLWFTGCGAGRRALGVHAASSSSSSDSDDASSFSRSSSSSSSSSSSPPSDPIESSEPNASPPSPTFRPVTAVPPRDASSPVDVATAKSCRLMSSTAWRYLLVSESCANVDVCADANEATEPYSLDPESLEPSFNSSSSSPSSSESEDALPSRRTSSLSAAASRNPSRAFCTSSSAHLSRSSSLDRLLSFRLASAAAAEGLDSTSAGMSGPADPPTPLSPRSFV
mmetsp:Transcript_6027/g.23212  ORF Transcript_6027/g.23212 Transcript_6027/m.23212 type:complete len:264 (+) Transcript_6027:2113-2904(+)